MKKLLPLLLVAVFGLCLTTFQTGCENKTTLEPGGAYSDVNLATVDRTILDASHALQSFVDWHAANATYLAQYPEVGALAAKVAAMKDGWIRDAYAARDAYASASVAYSKALASGQDVVTARDKLNAAMAVISNVTQQIIDYKTAHPHA